jgi:hypothetical protein
MAEELLKLVGGGTLSSRIRKPKVWQAVEVKPLLFEISPSDCLLEHVSEPSSNIRFPFNMKIYSEVSSEVRIVTCRRHYHSEG